MLGGLGTTGSMRAVPEEDSWKIGSVPRGVRAHPNQLANVPPLSPQVSPKLSAEFLRMRSRGVSVEHVNWPSCITSMGVIASLHLRASIPTTPPSVVQYGALRSHETKQTCKARRSTSSLSHAPEKTTR